MGRFPEDATSDFVYVRLHGAGELYASGYTEAALQSWTQKVRAWQKGGVPPKARLAGPRIPARRSALDVYVYFDNDQKVHAPFDASRSPKNWAALHLRRRFYGRLL